MAKTRRLADLQLGQPGLLAYVPADSGADGAGLLHSTRITTGSLYFGIVGSCAELYPPSKTPSPHVPCRLWRERQRQQRWLCKAHPEAFLGNQSFQKYLKEDMERFSKAEETTCRRPLLAVGLMNDLRDWSHPRGMPLLAVAAGASGEKLRLTRMDESEWQWGEEMDATLHLSIIDSACKDDEAMWVTDAVPISQVKAATYFSPSTSIRWLVVQKTTSTTILQPEYRPFRVPWDEAPEDHTHQQPLYVIDPNPLLTLHHHQTGGHAHSDVDFHPPTLQRPPQLAVLDECGYWTIWNILGTWHVDKKTLRLSLYMRGHMSEGVLHAIPSCTTYPAASHGLLYVGTSEIGKYKATTRQAGTLQAHARPSPYMLMWNSERYVVIDVESNSALPMPELLLHTRTTTDQILDIQGSLLQEDHVFVLTARRLIWLDLCCRDASSNGASKPTTILAFSHFGSGHEETRMSVSRASASESDTSLVFTYSSKAEQLCVYWFGFSQATKMPQWRRHVTHLPKPPSRTSILQLRVQPVRLERRRGARPGGLGSSYLRHSLTFYQVNVLGENLGVRYGIYTTSADPAWEITLPTTRVGWSRGHERKRERRKRRHSLRRMRHIFVLPDDVGQADMQLLSRETDEACEDSAPQGPEDESSRKRRPVLLKLDRFSQSICKQLDLAAAAGELKVPARLCEAMIEALEKGLLADRLPLTTWAEMANELELPKTRDMDEDAAAESVERLLSMSSDRAIVTQLGGHEPHQPSHPLQALSMLGRQLSEFWLDRAAGTLSEQLEQVRKIWGSEVARDVLLSSYGVMVQDVPLLGPRSAEAEAQNQAAMASSQLLGSSSGITPSTQAAPCSSASPAPTAADPATQRLRLLARSLEPDRIRRVQRARLLACWPTERGVDTRDYVSSVAMATEEMFQDAKERLQRREARRKALAERYRRPALTTQGLPTSGGPEPGDASLPPRRPPAQIMSSQQGAPESSQTQGPWITMSQPVAGTFGDRKKTKRAKRNSGFR